MRRVFAAILLMAVSARPSLGLAQGAMIFGSDTTATPPAVNLPTGNDYWFTNGNGSSIQATQVPDYWVNKVGAELENLVTGFGSAVDMNNRGQAAAALKASFVHMGDAPGQLHNTVHLGYEGGFLDLTVDVTDFGYLASQSWVVGLAHSWAAPQTFAGAVVPTQAAGDATANAASDQFVQQALTNFVGVAHSWSQQQNFLGAVVPTQAAGDVTANAASDLFVQQAVGARGNEMTFYAGTTNWTVPANITRVKIREWGAGGAGGGSQSGSDAAGGGAGGGYYEGYVSIAAGTVVSVTVGAPGQPGPGNSTTAGTAGGTTSFNGAFPVTGGGGGQGAANGAVGQGGTGGTGYAQGGSGGAGQQISVPGGSFFIGGTGGPSLFGGVVTPGTSGQAGASYGPGSGSAGGANGGGGGIASGGLLIVEW